MIDPSNFATHKNKPADYRRAKQMRREPTNGEDILWYELRVATKGLPIKFRRQYPLHPYIADFVCLKLRLVVEVDGVSHDLRLEKDKERDKHLLGMGYTVMRFVNSDVVQNRGNVVSAILNRANEILAGNL